MSVTVHIARSSPKAVEAVGVPVGVKGAVPRSLGLNRAALTAAGFEGKPGQTLVVPSATGPTQIAVGIGDERLTAAGLRNAAAALVRAAGKRTSIATTSPTSTASTRQQRHRRSSRVPAGRLPLPRPEDRAGAARDCRN